MAHGLRLHRLLALLLVCEAQYLPRDAQADRRDGWQSSTSHSLYLVSHNNFCLFGPPDPFNYIWNTGKNVVSWCSKSGHGTRLIPDGTLHGVTYVRARDWVQVSGTGDFTKINIAPNDGGGQFDSSHNRPDGAEMFVTDDNQRADSWVTLISADTFCVRACTGDARFCPTEYDQMGCWFLTGNDVGLAGEWQDCESDNGDPPTPPSPAAPSRHGCQAGASVGNGQAPPPLYSWDGSGSAVPINGGSPQPTATPTGRQTEQGQAQQGEGTSWVEVSTCTPCPTSTGNTTGTIQQGVTQLSRVADSTTGTPAAGDLLERDDTPTTTRDGQCCWATWMPSVVGSQSTSSANGTRTNTTTGTTRSLTLGGNMTASASASTTSLPPVGNASVSGNETVGNDTSTAVRDVRGGGLLGVIVTSFAIGIGAYFL